MLARSEMALLVKVYVGRLFHLHFGKKPGSQVTTPKNKEVLIFSYFIVCENQSHDQ